MELSSPKFKKFQEGIFQAQEKNPNKWNGTFKKNFFSKNNFSYISPKVFPHFKMATDQAAKIKYSHALGWLLINHKIEKISCSTG